MKFLILLVAVIVAGAFLYPPYAERTDTVCAAFEKRVATLAGQQAKDLPSSISSDPRAAAVLGAIHGTASVSSGLLAESYVRDQFPQLPANVGCVAGYWKTKFDPDL